MDTTPGNNTGTPVFVQYNIEFYLPFGAKLSDVFMDASQVQEEMNICKRTLQNWVETGLISYTLSPTGSNYYFRQEIAKVLFERKVCKIKEAAEKVV